MSRGKLKFSFMRKIVFGVLSVFALQSCGVEQFPVNTTVEPFQNGGRVFGEKTQGLKKGVDYAKSGTAFILGVNVLSDSKTSDMAKKINAEHYTIETKSNLLSILCARFTQGVIDYKVVKVIKREN
jgi:hypothetical protein